MQDPNFFCVVKTLWLHKVDTASKGLQAQNFVNVQSRLKDERGIATFYDVFWCNRELSVVMQYLPGGNLWSRMKTLRKRPSLLKTVLSQCCRAIRACHNHHVAYRDVKPENFVMEYDNTVKLIDFDASATLEPNVKVAYMCGTLEYMSPQVIQGQPAGYAADCWGLGVLCFEMTIGTTPFYAHNISLIKQRIVEVAYVIPKCAPDWVREIVKRTLVYDPCERWTVDQIIDCIERS